MEGSFGLPATKNNLYKKYKKKPVVIYTTTNTILYGKVQDIDDGLLKMMCISFRNTSTSVEPIENNTTINLGYVMGIREITPDMLNEYKKKYDSFSNSLNKIVSINKNSESYTGLLKRVTLDGLEVDVLAPKKGKLTPSGKAFIYFPIPHIFVLSEEAVKKLKKQQK